MSAGAILAIAHVASCGLALALGTAVALAPKGTAWHRRTGRGYVGAMVALNVSALGLYRLTGSFNAFHGFAVFSLATLAFGHWAARRARRSANAREAHARVMLWSYAGLWMAAASELAVRVPSLREAAGFGGAVALGTALVALAAAVLIEQVARRLRRA